MSTGTGIEWTEATWNPVVGCTAVSAGCANCYAVSMTHRLEAMGLPKYRGLTVLQPNGRRRFNGTVRTVEEALEIPLRWRKPRRVFVNSMSDLFHPDVPFDFIDRVFAVMALTPHHTYQVLTKRPERMAEYLGGADRLVQAGRHGAVLGSVHFQVWTNDETRGQRDIFDWPLPNVWLGTSCEDQKAADERILHLLRCPAAVRFLSCEPLLGAIELDRAWHGHTSEDLKTCEWCGGYLDPDRRHDCYDARPHIQWLIVGGESGPGARPCDVEWIRSVVRQAREAGVPCFVKQLGSGAPSMHTNIGRGRHHMDDGREFVVRDIKGGDPAEWPEDLRVREMPGGEQSGKRKAQSANAEGAA